ncbi:MAG TPA: protein kinase [Ktedonobacteraceae bacterium]
MDTLVGTSIGGYTLVKLLGTGGMGSVYLATDPTVGQQVAVKLIRTELDGYADSMTAQLALERFRQEARAVAGLDHLHILPLNRYGEEQTLQGPRAYMIMQYRPEGSLWDWLRRRADFASGQLQPTPAEQSAGLPMSWPLGLEEAADYLQQAASALQYAHDRSIVHRDIKPANFLLRFDLHEKHAHLLLGDFGLAKVFTGSSSTQTILGTPTYMAPEQFEGAARPASDQYALAVMIYYLLAGRPPFEGDPMQLMRQHISSPVPSITAINPDVSPLINSVLVRAMAKQGEQRFPTIASFAEMFTGVTRQVLSGQARVMPGGFAPAYTAARDDMPGMARSGLAASGPVSPPQPLVLPGMVERGYNTPLPPMSYPSQPSGGQIYMTPSPIPQAGRGIYGAQNQSGYQVNGDVYAQPSPFVQTPGFAPGYQQSGAAGQASGKVGRRGALGWILGGTALALVGGGAGYYFYTHSTQANTPPGPGTPANPALHILKGHSASVTSLSWLSDGSQLASGSLDQTVRLWSTANGTLTRTIQTSSSVNVLAWSPDGSQLATGQANHSLVLWSASGSMIKRETGWGAAITSLSWRTDGNLLFMGTNGNGVHAIQPSDYRHYGRNNPAVFVNSIAQSPDDKTLAVALAGGKVYFADLTKNWDQLSAINAEHRSAFSVAWSPDGSMVVVGYEDGKAVIYDAASKKVLYELAHKAAVNSVAWKPGSTSAAPTLVSGTADGSVNIWNLADKGSQIIYSAHSDAVLAVAWNATMLASASKDQSVIIWQAPNS